jgi:hypothetical protein
LEREGAGDPHSLPLQLVVVGLHVLDLDVQLHRPAGVRRSGPADPLLEPREHDPDAATDDGDEIEAAVLPDDAHHVLEAELLRVKPVDLVDRVDGHDRHDGHSGVAHRTSLGRVEDTARWA